MPEKPSNSRDRSEKRQHLLRFLGSIRLNWPFGTLSMNEAYRPLPPPTAVDDEKTLMERVERAAKLGRRALKHWKISAAILVLGTGASVFAASRTTFVYRSEARLQLRAGIRTNDRDDPGTSERAERLATKLKTGMPRGHLEPIIKEYGLFADVVESKTMLDAVEEMQTHIGVRSKGTDEILLSYDDEDKKRAQKVTQKIAEVVVGDYKKMHQSKSEEEYEFYKSEKAKSEEEMEAATRAYAGFLVAHPEFAVTNPSGQGIHPAGASVRPVAPSDPVLGNLFRQKQKLESELRGAAPAAAGSVVPVPDAALLTLSNAREEAAKRVTQAQAELSEKKASGLTDVHPDIASAKARLEQANISLRNADSNLQKAKQAAIAHATAQAGVVPPSNPATDELKKRIGDLENQMAARQAELIKAGGATPAAMGSPAVQLEADWQRLWSALSKATVRRDDVAVRYRAAELEANATRRSAQLQISEEATLPTHPFKGGRTKTGLIGLFVTAVIAFAYALLRVLMDDTVVDADDVVGLQGSVPLPVLGVIPQLPRLPGATPSARDVGSP